MLLRSCPACHGDLYLHSYLGEGESITDWECIQCSRAYPPATLKRVLLSHTECCSLEQAQALLRKARQLLLPRRNDGTQGRQGKVR